MLYQFAYISHQVKCFSETDLQQLMVKARIKNKCLELDLTSYWRTLSEQMKSNIYSLFNYEEISLDKGFFLLLTQPIELYSKLSEMDKINIYKEILDKYADVNILIKPHYLETTSYEHYFPNVTVFRGSYPIELLAMNINNPGTVLTLFSTGALAFEKRSKVLWFSNYNKKELIDTFGQCQHPFYRCLNED